MEFILEQQAHMSAHLAEADAHLAEADARLAEADAHLAKGDAHLAKVDRHLAEITRHQAKTDRQLAIIGLMVRAGMKQLGSLTQAQKRTDKKFERLIDLLTKQSGNGRRR